MQNAECSNRNLFSQSKSERCRDTLISMLIYFDGLQRDGNVIDARLVATSSLFARLFKK